MQGKEKLHQAEKKLFCSAPRFARQVRNGNYKQAGGIVAGVASAFAALAYVKEARLSPVSSELSNVLEHIHDVRVALEGGAMETALHAYAQVVRIIPDAHMRVEALLQGALVDTDPGTRGNDKHDLIQAAQQAMASLGLG